MDWPLNVRVENLRRFEKISEGSLKTKTSLQFVLQNNSLTSAFELDF